MNILCFLPYILYQGIFHNTLILIHKYQGILEEFESKSIISGRIVMLYWLSQFKKKSYVFILIWRLMYEIIFFSRTQGKLISISGLPLMSCGFRGKLTSLFHYFWTLTTWMFFKLLYGSLQPQNVLIFPRSTCSPNFFVVGLQCFYFIGILLQSKCFCPLQILMLKS